MNQNAIESLKSALGTSQSQIVTRVSSDKPGVAPSKDKPAMPPTNKNKPRADKDESVLYSLSCDDLFVPASESKYFNLSIDAY